MKYKNLNCTRLLSALMDPNGTAASYAIMIDGKIVAADAIGMVNTKTNTPVNVDCTFNVASISKIYSTVAIMQLIEQGKISLDDYVYRLLPEFWMPDDRYKNITLRMCLDHSSGLPGTQWKHFNVTNVNEIDYYQEVLDYFAHSHLKADPGAYSVYCNDGFTLAEMIVAKVSGMDYATYLKTHISDVIGANSTRTSLNRNESYPLVIQNNRELELLLVQGAGGVTTSMIDLCKFGNCFLEKNEMISENSKSLMAIKWGKSFLDTDSSTCNYGLGWDTVDYHDPYYDLGDHVLIKGGNSMCFTSRLIVIPKYNAVLALAFTDDCKMDVQATLLRLFATYMINNGKNITVFDNYKCKDVDGVYLLPTSALKLTSEAFSLVIEQDNFDHQWVFREVLNYKDGQWINDKKDAYWIEKFQNNQYLMKCTSQRSFPYAMKAVDRPGFSNAWKQRLGKRYIVCNISAYDLTIRDLCASFTVEAIDGVKGILKISTSVDRTTPSIGMMELPFIPLNDDVGKPYLTTPYHGSRDSVDPFFEVVDGKEYCDVLSYRYVAMSDIESYTGQVFVDSQWNQVYLIENQLNELPSIPNNRRIVVLDSNGDFYYDSLSCAKFKGIEHGVLIMI